MSAIILCDRCGSIATEKVAGSITYQLSPNVDETSAGICPGCVKEFHQWMVQTLTDDGAKPMVAYREPFSLEPGIDDHISPAESTRDALRGHLE